MVHCDALITQLFRCLSKLLPLPCFQSSSRLHTCIVRLTCMGRYTPLIYLVQSCRSVPTECRNESPNATFGDCQVQHICKPHANGSKVSGSWSPYGTQKILFFVLSSIFARFRFIGRLVCISHQPGLQQRQKRIF